MKSLNKILKSNKGITLVSIVVVIIVMIIIGAVVGNNLLGDRSVLDRSQETKQKAELRARQELLEQALIKYNSGNYNAVGGSGTDGFINYLCSELGYSIADIKVLNEGNNIYIQNAFGEPGWEILLSRENEFWKLEDCGENVVPDEIKNSTANNFVKAIDDNQSIEFKDNDNYTIYVKGGKTEIKDFNFDIPRDSTVTITLASDMKITNDNLDRPAINLNPGATLNLNIEKRVEVSSTTGKDAGRANGSPGSPGKGGYAGIHVPEGTTINISGGRSATLIARGGDAGSGSDAAAGDVGGSGGGGAGAGIGGNGGSGGAGAGLLALDGNNGENAGNINILGQISVTAYGGAGGSSGQLKKENAGDSGSGTGGGGYPAAGIGGGGAGGGGGNHVNGGGGFSSGTAECDSKYNIQINGAAPSNYSNNYAAGGSYYSAGVVSNFFKRVGKTTIGSHKGGQGPAYIWSASYNDMENHPEVVNHKSGNVGSGGAGGKGGNLVVASTARVTAYNGNKCTVSKDEAGYFVEYTNIYIQDGKPLDIYVNSGNGSANNLPSQKFKFIKDQFGYDTSSWKQTDTFNTMTEYCFPASERKPANKVAYGQGIGSGAGYIEISNGTYTRK